MPTGYDTYIWIKSDCWGTGEVYGSDRGPLWTDELWGIFVGVVVTVSKSS